MRIFLIFIISLVFLADIFPQSKYEANPVKYTPAIDRLKSFEQRNEQMSLFSGIRFRSIGPAVMSGRVVDIEVNVSDPTVFYVAFASGGVWKTLNNGITYIPVFDNLPCMTIGDIAVDWSKNVLYVGTGENNSSRSSYAGTGIYKTTDDGKTWVHLGLAETHRTGRIIINPKNPDIIYVAALGHLYSSNEDRGVYKSTDAGLTWKKVLYIDDITGAIDIIINPSNPDVLLAATWDRERRAWDVKVAGTGSGIYKSVNGGESWAKLKECGLPDGEGLGRIGLALCESKPDIVYAIIDNNFTKPSEENETEGKEQDANSKLFSTEIKGAEVYRSNDGGNTWKKTHGDYLEGMFYTYGYYFANIRVSPVNPDKIYLLGVPIIKSNDGGKTFESANGDNVHADHHALWINPNKEGHLINGNDGGVNISYDDGLNWYKSNSPSVGQFYSVNFDNAKPYNVYGGLQDNGVWYGPSTNEENAEWHNSGQYPFKPLIGGDGMQVQIDLTNNDIVYTGYQFGNYYRIKKSTKDYKYITPVRKDIKLRFNWQTPILLSAHDPDVIYMGTQYLLKSVDKGDSFTVISKDLTNEGKKGEVPYGTLTAISESSMKQGLIYTGSDDGMVYVTIDDGESWTQITSGLPENLWVSRVTASAFDTGTVYIALNGYRWDNFEPYIYKSTNYGNDWIRTGMNLPLEPVNVIKEDPSDKNILYAGTDAGLYVSIDCGKTFMNMNGNMPNAPLHDIAIQPEFNELISGSHGRSIYIAKLESVRKIAGGKLKPLQFLNVNKVRYSGNWGKRTFDWRYNIPVNNAIEFYSANNEKGTLSVKTEKGLLLYERQIKCVKGLNYYDYDLSVDDGNSGEYSAQVNKIKDANYRRGANGKYYLWKGKYILEIIRGSDVDSAILELFEPDEPEDP
jgi:photosystem II stability/assembly factor-like uncharacterized protein